MKFLVAVAQYAVPEDVSGSISKLDELAAKVAKDGARLLVAPETAIGMLADVKTASTDYLPDLKNIASEHKIAIATSFYKKSTGGEHFNQGYIVSSSGEVLHSHRKIYLAPPEREVDGISSGHELTVSKTEIGKLGMLICKDGFNRYSHFLYERFNQLGTEIICIPTWSIGWDEMNTQEYIRSLFVYGSFTSRAYVLVSGNLNRKDKSFGRSLIVSPVRGVLREGSTDQEELIVQEIDLKEVKTARDFDSRWQPKGRIL